MRQTHRLRDPSTRKAAQTRKYNGLYYGAKVTTPGRRQRLSKVEHSQAMRKEFDKFAKSTKLSAIGALRRRQRMQRNEKTVGLVTQNVRGISISKGTLSPWLTHFRQAGPDGAHAIVLIQETHVEKHEIPKAVAAHSRHCGHDTQQEGGTFSYGSPAQGRRGGVAVLINPYVPLGPVRSVHHSPWTAHWMAVEVCLIARR